MVRQDANRLVDDECAPEDPSPPVRVQKAVSDKDLGRSLLCSIAVLVPVARYRQSQINRGKIRYTIRGGVLLDERQDIFLNETMTGKVRLCNNYNLIPFPSKKVLSVRASKSD